MKHLLLDFSTQGLHFGFMAKSKGKAQLIGVGLDSDGHKRITRGENFTLVGGTQETHEEMTEKAIKINEKLAGKGKSLDQVSREEFHEIAQQVGLQPHQPPSRN